VIIIIDGYSGVMDKVKPDMPLTEEECSISISEDDIGYIRFAFKSSGKTEFISLSSEDIITAVRALAGHA
jgi:hypothetical protein